MSYSGQEIVALSYTAIPIDAKLTMHSLEDQGWYMQGAEGKPEGGSRVMLEGNKEPVDDVMNTTAPGTKPQP
jgi:hypothetical protein